MSDDRSQVPEYFMIPPGYGPLVAKALADPLRVVLSYSFDRWLLLKFKGSLFSSVSGVTPAWISLAQPDNRDAFLQLTFECGPLQTPSLQAELRAWSRIALGYVNKAGVFTPRKTRQIGITLPMSTANSVAIKLRAELGHYNPRSVLGRTYGPAGDAMQQELSQGESFASFIAAHQAEQIFGGLTQEQQVEVLRLARGTPPTTGAASVLPSPERLSATFAALCLRADALQSDDSARVASQRVFYKAATIDGTDFDDPSARYGPDAWISANNLRQREGTGLPKGFIDAHDAPAESLIGAAWPCRLYQVEGDPTSAQSPEYPHARLFKGFRVLTELPAWKVFGPLGQLLVQYFERLANIDASQWRAIVAYRRAIESAETLSRTQTAWDAMYEVAEGEHRVKAVDAAYAIADGAARRYAYLAPWYDALRAAPRGSSAEDEAARALAAEREIILEIGWGAIGRLVGEDGIVAGLVAATAGSALVVADKLDHQYLSLLIEPLNACVEPAFWNSGDSV